MHRVCKISDLPDGSLKKFTVNENDICVGNHNGKIFACNNSCPHRAASMHKGYFNGNNVVCYMHYFEFDSDSGKLEKISEKWKDQSPVWRKSDDLTMYDITIKNDELYISPR